MEQTMGKRIMSHRKRLGMTQDQLAERLGVTAQAVSKWENDQSCPDISILPALADIFGVSVDELLGREGAKVHQGEVEDREPEDIHAQSSRHGLDIHYNTGRKNALGLAVWVLTVGILYLLARALSWQAGLWDILWPTGLLMFGLFGLWPKFSFFRLGCALFGCGFLADNLGLLPDGLDRGLLLPLLIILFGLSLLADALRRPAKPTFGVSWNGQGQNSGSKTGFWEKDGYFTFNGSFGELRQQVDMPLLRGGEIKTSFGEYTLDLSGVEAVTGDCAVTADCSFGDLELLIPRRFQVKTANRTAFASVEVQGAPSDIPAGTIRLEANASFGQISLNYI